MGLSLSELKSKRDEYKEKYKKCKDRIANIENNTLPKLKDEKQKLYDEYNQFIRLEADIAKIIRTLDLAYRTCNYCKRKNIRHFKINWK